MKNKHAAALELAAIWISKVALCQKCPCRFKKCADKYPYLDDCVPAIVAYFLKEAEENK